MGWGQWLKAFKQATGWTSVAGNTKYIKEDYKAGMTPEQAARKWRNEGITPSMPVAVLDNWLRAI
jgi:hypothetical protein